MWCITKVWNSLLQLELKEDLYMLNFIKVIQQSYLSISRNSYAANSYRLGEYFRQECCILALFLYSKHQLLVSAGNKFLSFGWTVKACWLFLYLWANFCCTTTEQHPSCSLEVDIQASPHWSLFPAVLLLENECNFPSPVTCGWVSLWLSECLPNEH